MKKVKKTRHQNQEDLLLQIDIKQSRFENGVFLLYFNADGRNDRVLIPMAPTKLFSMITLKHTHVSYYI
jgi:hypothetical protein